MVTDDEFQSANDPRINIRDEIDENSASTSQSKIVKKVKIVDNSTRKTRANVSKRTTTTKSKISSSSSDDSEYIPKNS